MTACVFHFTICPPIIVFYDMSSYYCLHLHRQPSNAARSYASTTKAMVLSMGRAERTREDITSKRHRWEEELSHPRIVEERLIASNEQGQAESRHRVEHARERKEEAKLRGKEIGRQRALLHQEERQRQEKERERQGEKERARQQQRARWRAGGDWNR